MPPPRSPRNRPDRGCVRFVWRSPRLRLIQLPLLEPSGFLLASLSGMLCGVCLLLLVFALELGDSCFKPPANLSLGLVGFRSQGPNAGVPLLFPEQDIGPFAQKRPLELRADAIKLAVKFVEALGPRLRPFGLDLLHLSAVCCHVAIMMHASDLTAGSPEDHTSERFHSRVQGGHPVFRDVGNHGELAGRKGSTHVIDKLVGHPCTIESDDESDQCASGRAPKNADRSAESPHNRACQAADTNHREIHIVRILDNPYAAIRFLGDSPYLEKRNLAIAVQFAEGLEACLRLALFVEDDHNQFLHSDAPLSRSNVLAGARRKWLACGRPFLVIAPNISDPCFQPPVDLSFRLIGLRFESLNLGISNALAE